MKKNRKASLMYHMYDKIVRICFWGNRKLARFEERKTDRIYRRSGFGPAFDYLRQADRRFSRRIWRIRRLVSKRDHYFCEQFEGRA